MCFLFAYSVVRERLHSDIVMKVFFIDAKAALHLVAQSPHPLHLASIIWTLNNENRLNNFNIVPTGQIVLHHVRPISMPLQR